MAITTRTITATYQHADGTPATGYITLTPNTTIPTPTDDTIVWPRPIYATLDDTGTITATVVATGQAGVGPDGWVYRVEEHVTGATRAAWFAEIPAGGGPLDLADVTPLESVPELAAYVRLDSPPFTDRGVLQPATDYARWDVVAYRGRKILVTAPLTSGAGIASDLDEASYIGLAGWGPTIPAYDYGFRADGSQASAAANVAALQAAADDAARLQAACVVLPAGFGFINATVDLGSRVSLRGAGQFSSTLQLADDANCHMIRTHTSTDGAADPNAAWCTISDLTLDGRGTAQTGPGPYHGLMLVTNPLSTAAPADLAHDPSHLVQNVHVRNCLDDGIHIEGRSDVRLIGCKVSHAGGDSYRLSWDTHAVECISEKPAKAGFRIAGSSTRLTGCKSYLAGQGSQGAARPSVPAQGHGYVVEGAGIGEITLAACDAQQTAGHGFLLDGVEAVTLAGVTVAEASFGQGTTYAGFVLDGASRCVITATSRHNSGVHAVHLTGGADRNTVTVGHAPLPGQTATSVLTAGSAVLDNRIIGNGAPIAVRQAWAPATAYLAGQELTYLGRTYRATGDHTSGATFALDNLALLSAPMAGTSVPPGKTIFPGGGASPSTGQTGTGTLRAYPWYLPHPVTLTRLGCEVTGAGNAGSLVRLAIYADTGALQPGALLLDAGTIDGATVGVQEITINQTLPAGVYWVGAVVQAVTTTQPTLRTTGQGPYALPVPGTPAAGLVAAGYTHGVAVTGAAPAVFSPGSPVGVIPRIHVRAA